MHHPRLSKAGPAPKLGGPSRPLAPLAPLNAAWQRGKRVPLPTLHNAVTAHHTCGHHHTKPRHGQKRPRDTLYQKDITGNKLDTLTLCCSVRGTLQVRDAKRRRGKTGPRRHLRLGCVGARKLSTYGHARHVRWAAASPVILPSRSLSVRSNFHPHSMHGGSLPSQMLRTHSHTRRHLFVLPFLSPFN